MRELRELHLPRLVEARRKRESAGSEFDLAELQNEPPLHQSQSSISSDPYSSPATPTFSLRCHSRFPSSSSSLASSPAMRDSIDGFASKRPLTEVKEEPHQERDIDFEMLESPLRELENEDQAVHNLDYSDHHFPSPADYDWIDSPCDEEDFDFGASKRLRAGDHSPTGFTRLGSRFPTLSRKWKSRKEARKSSLPESLHESIVSRSRASSMRSPSLLDTRTESIDRRDPPVPSTPALSFVDDRYEDAPCTPSREDPESNGDVPEDVPEALARTPLLPPVMAMLRTSDPPVQSPLQSPSIAESPKGAFPFDTPSLYNGLPSPPLSTKPSISSFHHRAIAPASEIPPIILAEPNDEWSFKLGHANFTIYPEPYIPLSTTLEACRLHRADWDAARQSFMNHLVRTGEHHGTTSKIYHLTEEKWASIDSAWRRNHEDAVLSACHQSQEGLDLSQPSLQELAPITKIPSLYGPNSDGKFPKIGEDGIVGPMEQIKPVCQRSTKKRAFWKFLQGVLPASIAFGRA